MVSSSIYASLTYAWMLQASHMNVCKPHIWMYASLTYGCMHEAASVDHCLVHYTTDIQYGKCSRVL